MWQFFTDPAKKVVQLAHREALRLGYDVIGTEHILLGILAEGEGLAVQALDALGINMDDLRERLERTMGQSTPILKPVDLPLSPRAKHVLDLSIREARNMGVNYVGTEHLLLGLLAEGEGIVPQTLLSLGVDHPLVAKEITRLLSEGGAGQGNKEGESRPRGRVKTPTLDQLAIDLSEKSRKGELDPVIGREKEIRRIIQILSRRTKNNPVLIGEPGVGKTAIVEGLAQRIIEGNVPELLKDKRVVQLNMGNLVAGTKYRGEFEERMRKLVKELTDTKDVILFIDEVHTIVGAGGAEGAVDAANILKPSLSRGEFQVIGATTLDEYRKHIEKDAALERRFQPVQVQEPTVADSIRILEGLRDRYEVHHKTKIQDDALEAAARLSARYITDRKLPDKGIDLIDEAAARARIKAMETPDELKARSRELENIRRQKETAVEVQDFEKAAQYRDEENRLSRQLEEETEEWRNGQSSYQALVTSEDIANVISEWTGIPVTQLTGEESERLLRMEEEIACRLVGQDEAVTSIARAIRRARSGLKDPKRPIGSFLLLGPTGVGKTELARCLARFLFGSEETMIRLDMSEFMEKHEVSKLIGAPPGYVGYEEGGKLTEAVRRRPYSVVLFDEIEKAHPDVFNMMLQILDDGRLTDGQGATVDFRNTVILMTSNVGARDMMKGTTLGFSGSGGSDHFDWDKMKGTILDEVNRLFRPEFLNRLDEMIVFRPLSRENMMKIVDIMLSDVRERLTERGIDLVLSPEVRDRILERGYQPKFGARPLRRAIQTIIENRLADYLLEPGNARVSAVEAYLQDDEVLFRALSERPEEAPPLAQAFKT
mgnify:CR=1 FL=1